MCVCDWCVPRVSLVCRGVSLRGEAKLLKAAESLHKLSTRVDDSRLRQSLCNSVMTAMCPGFEGIVTQLVSAAQTLQDSPTVGDHQRLQFTNLYDAIHGGKETNSFIIKVLRIMATYFKLMAEEAELVMQASILNNILVDDLTARVRCGCSLCGARSVLTVCVCVCAGC